MKKMYVVRAVELLDKVTSNRYIASKAEVFNTRAAAIEYRDRIGAGRNREKAHVAAGGV